MNVLVDCTQTGDIVLKTLYKKIGLVITIKPKFAKKNNLSGYVDHKPFCKEKGIKVYYPQKFNLTGKKDLKLLNKIKPKLLIVLGWQRIIPGIVLYHCKVAIGNHGSWKKLPFGRGHSPMNWALIKDKKIHYSHLFYLEPGVDSGDIIDYIKFKITSYDTIDSMYKKNGLCVLAMLFNNWKDILKKKKGTPQKGKPLYLPKRTPKDGLITPDMTTKETYNLIRAVTKPYPGAYIYNGKESKLVIWKAYPFGVKLLDGAAHRIYMFGDTQFLLGTKDGSILITEWETIK